jgi:hypothetical protein
VNGNSIHQTSNYANITITTIDYDNNYNDITIKYPNILHTYPTSQYLTDSYNNKILNTNAYQIVGKNGFYNILISPSRESSNCDVNKSIPTPTSSSDVPGPIIYLYNDETVPLYNFNTNIAFYSKDTNSAIQDPWLITSMSDIYLTNTVSSNLLTMLITNQINQSSYSFSLQIPFSIYVKGTNIIIDPSNNWYYPGLSTGLTYIEFNVNYNGKPVTFATPPQISLTTTTTQQLIHNQGFYSGDSTLSNLIYYDVSFNAAPIGYTDSYAATIYTGIISISDILLTTNPGYVYDFTIQINTNNIQLPPSLENRYNRHFLNGNTGIIANVSNNNTTYTNCLPQSLSPSPPIIQSLILTGV